MNGQSHHILRLALWTLVLCTAPGFVMADYAIDWHTVDGGGTTSSGGAFTLAFNTAGWESQNVLFKAVDAILEGSGCEVLFRSS